MRNGLGFNPLPTLDWNILSFHYTSPLVVPFFNTINGFIGMFLSFFGIIAMWYKNAFHTAHLPINSQRVFDRFGRHYNVSRVIDDRGMFDRAKFEAYSPPYLGAGYLNNYAMFFALYAATISHAFLYHRREIWRGFKGLRKCRDQGFYKDVHNRLMAAYPEGMSFLMHAIQVDDLLTLWGSAALVVFCHSTPGRWLRCWWHSRLADLRKFPFWDRPNHYITFTSSDYELHRPPPLSFFTACSFVWFLSSQLASCMP